MIYVAAGQLTLRAHDKEEVFDVYKAFNMQPIYEELFVITVIDLETESKYVVEKDLLELVLMGDDIYNVVESHEIVQFLDVSLIFIVRE